MPDLSGLCRHFTSPTSLQWQHQCCYFPQVPFPELKSRYRGNRAGKKVKERSSSNLKIQSIVTQRCTQRHANSVRERTLININVSQNQASSSNVDSHLALWNARSLSKKSTAVCDTVLSENIDIMLITESWLKDDVRDSPIIADITNSLPDHQVFQQSRSSRGGGVCAILRKGYSVKRNTTSVFKSFEHLDLRVESGFTHLRIIVVYRPPPSKKNKLSASQFFDEFSTFLETVSIPTHNLIIAGDFNFHLDAISRNSDASAFADLLSSFGLIQHVQDPTHERGHLLDLIITKSAGGLVIKPNVTFGLPSDHALISCRVTLPRPRPTRVLVTRRKLRSINLDEFRESVICSSLAREPSADLSSLTEQFDTVLCDLLEQHAPQCTRYVTLRPHAPWFDDSLRNAKLIKRRLERKWRLTRLEVDRQIYRQYCATYQQLLKNAKSTYHNNKLKDLDQKALFREVDMLVHGRKAMILPTNIVKSDLPAAFGDHFKSKVVNLRSSTTDSEHLFALPENTCSVHLTEFILPDADEIRSIVMRSPSKSCSLDPVPTVLLKECIDVLLPIIMSIINSSLASGSVPTVFKSALVTPCIKKPKLDANILNNYRPISNLRFLSKVLERAVLPQLLSYLHENKLYPEFQSAYRPCHSTETALLRVQNDLLRILDEGNEAFLILLDFSAAFDTIDHCLLLQRLEKRFGFSGTVISWFHSYLNNRTQCVKIDSSLSPNYLLESGVPQGSVLGPVLFCLYVAPLEDIFTSHGISPMTYADDTQLYCVIQKHQQDSARSTLENCIRDIKSWCSANKLVLNDGKTELLHIHSKFTRSLSTLPGIAVGDKIIAPKPEARNLGVLFDHNLSLKGQITNCCKVSFMALSNIAKIRRYLDQDQAEKLVHAFVTTRVDHCNSLLYGLPAYEINKLQRVLNAAARVVARPKPDDNIQDTLRRLHWLPVQDRIIYKILLLTYKVRNGLAPQYLTCLLNDYSTTRCLRSTTRNLLAVPRTYTKTYGDRAFSAVAPKLWNTLPAELKNSASVDIFKSKLKTFLFK